MFELLYILLLLGFVVSSYMILRTSSAWVAAGVIRKGGVFAGIASVVTVTATFAHWPIMSEMLKKSSALFIIVITLVISGSSAALVIELLRSVTPVGERWTGSMHRNLFLLLWLALFALQCSGMAFLRNSP